MARMQLNSLFVSLLLAASVCLVNGKSMRSRRAAAEVQVQQAPKQQVTKRAAADTSSFRYYNNDTAPYNVESLPLIDLDIGEFYSGMMSVNDSLDAAMFFVFQPTVGEPVDEVTIWFNGGPGCSSLEGFLQENGMFQWAWGMYSAEINPYSWPNLTKYVAISIPF
jgi:carboxypeptidase D